jgi:hypothetical protein
MHVKVSPLIAKAELEGSLCSALSRGSGGFGNSPTPQSLFGLDGSRQPEFLFDCRSCRCGPMQIEWRREAIIEKSYLPEFAIEIGFKRFHAVAPFVLHGLGRLDGDGGLDAAGK